MSTGALIFMALSWTLRSCSAALHCGRAKQSGVVTLAARLSAAGQGCYLLVWSSIPLFRRLHCILSI